MLTPQIQRDIAGEYSTVFFSRDGDLFSSNWQSIAGDHASLSLKRQDVRLAAEESFESFVAKELSARKLWKKKAFF